VQGQFIDAGNAQALTQIDVIFPIVHGTLGEDGSLQGMLRMANLPFVGSDVLGSAACMDKDVTKRLLRDAGLNIAPFITLTRANRDKHSFASISAQLGLPLFVKPANQGSSVGVSKVNSEAQFDEAVRLALGSIIKWWLSRASKAVKLNVRYWATISRRRVPVAKWC
jgi:D-alanine-D-alanine ligase